MSSASAVLLPPAPPTRVADPAPLRVGDRLLMWSILAAPFLAALALVAFRSTFRPDGWDFLVFACFYLVGAFGITIGYHRAFTHHALRPRRPLKVALAVGGSVALEGGVIGWAAVHRRHHQYSDRIGDPHSPHLHGPGFLAKIKGFGHAHVGWMLTHHAPGTAEQVPDLARDRDLVAVQSAFPWIAIFTVASPFFIGWLVHGTIAGALTMFLLAGPVRIGLGHHVTFAINSVCHVTGRQPFRTSDQSRNVWWLSLISLGESWHNAHHAFPQSARHGVGRGQIDLSARVIRLFEQMRLADRVQWPDSARLSRRRVNVDVG